MNSVLDRYKNIMMKIDNDKQILESDKKKLLSLPFFLTKRKELPEPKVGQKEWDLFAKMYGQLYNEYDDKEFDDEEKITEFNYEKFLPKYVLDNVDSKSDAFKQLVKS